MARDNLEISIIIVSYNSHRDLERAVNSIFEYLSPVNYEIIIVDNSSDVQTIRYLKTLQSLDRIKIVFLNRNLGFGRANNIGASLAMAPILLLMNPDIELDNTAPDQIKVHNTLLNANPLVGAIAPRLIKPDGGTDTNFRLTISPLSLLLGRYKKIFQNHDTSSESGSSQKMLKVEALAGAYVLLRSRDFQFVQGFSPEYFMYGEDLDLSYKLKLLGYDLLLDKRFVVRHRLGTSAARNPFKMIKEMYVSTAIFYLKRLVLPRAFRLILLIILAPLILFEIALRILGGNKRVSD